MSRSQESIATLRGGEKANNVLRLAVAECMPFSLDSLSMPTGSMVLLTWERESIHNQIM